MTIERARELARMYFDEALNRGNLAVVDEIVGAHVKPRKSGSTSITITRVS